MRRIIKAKEPDAARMNAGKRFGQYKKEKRKEERKEDVKKDVVLAQLSRVWERYFNAADDEVPESNYPKAIKHVRNIDYSARDVEKLSLLNIFSNVDLTEFDYVVVSSIMGSFFSALINYGKEESYTIYTRNLPLEINYLCYRNQKSVLIHGNCGISLGQEMKEGNITVFGNTGALVGNGMENGFIMIDGNAENCAGSGMKSGKIIIIGDAGYEVGGYDQDVGSGGGMEGGEIHISGEIGSIAKNVIHGKIYHKGKLIVDK